MYVQCERCQTEYDFDDALVSEKGTTVKCTSCGHQFRVRRNAGPAQEDKWVINTGEGNTLIFTTLRELQRAISSRMVTREDVLARGNAPARKLGTIAELEPFFLLPETALKVPAAAPEAAKVVNPDQSGGPLAAANEAHLPVVSGVPKQTLLGTGTHVGADADAETLPPPAPLMPSEAPAPPVGPPLAPPEAQGPARAVWKSTRIGLGIDAEEVRALSGDGVLASTAAGDGALAPTVEFPVVTDDVIREQVNHARSPMPGAQIPASPMAMPAAAPAAGGSRLAYGDGSSARVSPLPAVAQALPVPTFPPPTAPVKRSEWREDEDEEPSDMRRRRPLSEMVDPLPERRRGGWLIALVLLAAIGVVAVAMYGRPYLARIMKPRVAAPAGPDARMTGFLAQGEAALDQGNLDAAKENFDKASAFADKDPRVLLDVARLAVVRADVPWLRERLLSGDGAAGKGATPEAGDEVKANQAELDDRVAQAKKAAADALAGAPNDVAAKRVKVDAMRLAGDKDGAHAVASGALLNAAEPANAYVLAALDLMDPGPPSAQVIERLRNAAGAEGALGRARAALVYALARSGDAAGARAELEKLEKAPRPHPLVAALHAYIDRVAPAGDAGAPEQTPPGASAPSAGASGPAPEPAPPGHAARVRAAARALANDSGQRDLQQAESAKNHNDLARAKSLYQVVLARNPHNAEALTGMGDVARGQRDLAGAQGYYRRALAENSSYSPALVGLGDVQWEMGDHRAASRTYQDIVERLPEGSYPSRVRQRIQDANAPSSPNPEQP